MIFVDELVMKSTVMDLTVSGRRHFVESAKASVNVFGSTIFYDCLYWLDLANSVLAVVLFAVF